LTNYYSKNKKFGLDIGCKFKPYDDDIKCEYIGIDLQSERFLHSEKKPDIYTSGTNLPFVNNSFDFINCYSVIPYVKNPDTLFSEIYRVLKSEGTAVMIIMNLRGLDLQPKTHFENRYSSKKLHQKLREHNFISIKPKNLKALLFSSYYDRTSVYSYAIVTPKK